MKGMSKSRIYGENITRFSLIILLFLMCIWKSTSECEIKFISRPGGPQNGTFTAPHLINPQNTSQMCVYTFHAGQHQRVQVTFTSYILRGTPPECSHEYLDLYTAVQNVDTADFTNSPFDGRFCNLIRPRSRISLYRAIVFSFYTDQRITTPDIFTGNYAFINDSEYQVGIPTPNRPCSFTIKAEGKRKGVIMSPTYPGVYPKPLECSFLFSGESGQRVHLEFRDFDLFSGGTHCPFDVVKVFDGKNESFPLIGNYCGQHRNLIIYSSEENFYVTFSVIARTTNTQNRGFKGFYEFSETFVKLEFIGKNGGEHIRGTECDQKVLSTGESSGFVFSPNYPFPFIPKTVCRYFIYGMQDSQNLERVRLEFVMFDIRKGDEKEECTDRYLKIYLKGDATDFYDKFDYEFCGNNLPPSMVSDGPRVVMIFASGDTQGRGFKAKYTFETEYLIPGTPSPGAGCHFSYRGLKKKQGEFNSPRYPANYPSSTNCTYIFYTPNNEQVAIIFEQFKVRADRANPDLAQYGEAVCKEDWLEIYNMFRDHTEKKIGRYCGVSAPGPLESAHGAVGLKILFRTDEKDVYSGFKARYAFQSVKPIFGDCGRNISGLEDGVLQSTNFPIKYENPAPGQAIKICDWYINVRPGYKVLLNFRTFILEGSPPSRGCSAAVVRMWLNGNDALPIEICGEKVANESLQFTTHLNHARISFSVADKSSGGEGFNMTWSEVAASMTDTCDEFKCAINGYCIPKNLHCNNISDCGHNDRSDEIDCIIEPEESWMVNIIAGFVCVICIILLMVCLVCQRKRHQERHVMSRLPAGSVHSFSGHQHVCDDLGQRFASVDSV